MWRAWTAKRADAAKLVMQAIANALATNARGHHVVVFTALPQGVVAASIRDALRRRIVSESGNDGPAAMDAQQQQQQQQRVERLKACLARVSITRIFDLDGLWEVLAGFEELGREWEERRGDAASDWQSSEVAGPHDEERQQQDDAAQDGGQQTRGARHEMQQDEGQQDEQQQNAGPHNGGQLDDGQQDEKQQDAGSHDGGQLDEGRQDETQQDAGPHNNGQPDEKQHDDRQQDDWRHVEVLQDKRPQHGVPRDSQPDLPSSPVPDALRSGQDVAPGAQPEPAAASPPSPARVTEIPDSQAFADDDFSQDAIAVDESSGRSSSSLSAPPSSASDDSLGGPLSGYQDAPLGEHVDETLEELPEETLDESLGEALDAPSDEPLDALSDEPLDELPDEPLDAPPDEPLDASPNEPLDESLGEALDVPADEPLDGPPDEPLDGPPDEPLDGPSDELLSGPLHEPPDGYPQEPLHHPLDEPSDISIDQSLNEPLGHPPHERPQETRHQTPSDDPPESHLPTIILIPHMSSLLNGYFATHEKAAAHHAVEILARHIHRLSRTLPTKPLVILLNSTATIRVRPTSEYAHAPFSRHDSSSLPKPRDPLLSIFNMPPPAFGFSANDAPIRRVRPSFGHTFAQLADVHLLCTRVPRSVADAETLYDAQGSRRKPRSAAETLASGAARLAWVVEVLHDSVGVWVPSAEDSPPARTYRDQRWGVVDVERDGGVVNAFEHGVRGEGGKAEMHS
jgi:hypothetical protein